MRIVTAFNNLYQRVAENCAESVRRHCERFPKDSLELYHVPGDFPFAPSWFKVNVIMSALNDHDRVLWIDADAMICGRQDFMSIINHDVTLNVSVDANGINCGVMAWRQCEESFAALTKLLGMRDEFKDHEWWEQGALRTFVDTLSVHYPEKKVFNAYPEEQCLDTQILHIPGLSIHDRTLILEERLKTC